MVDGGVEKGMAEWVGAYYGGVISFGFVVVRSMRLKSRGWKGGKAVSGLACSRMFVLYGCF